MPAKRKEEVKEEVLGTFFFADGSSYSGHYAPLSALIAEAAAAATDTAGAGKRSSSTHGLGAASSAQRQGPSTVAGVAVPPGLTLSPALAEAATTSAAIAAVSSITGNAVPAASLGMGSNPATTAVASAESTGGHRVASAAASHAPPSPTAASPLRAGRLDPPLAHGMGVYKDCTGAVYEGPWREGRMSGAKGIALLPKGSSYVGGFLDGKYHGFGTYTWADGSLYEGDFEDGTLHGRGVYVDVHGRRWHGVFVRGQSTELEMEIDI